MSSKRPYTPAVPSVPKQRGIYSDILGKATREDVAENTRGPDVALSTTQLAFQPDHVPHSSTFKRPASGKLPSLKPAENSTVSLEPRSGTITFGSHRVVVCP